MIYGGYYIVTNPKNKNEVVYFNAALHAVHYILSRNEKPEEFLKDKRVKELARELWIETELHINGYDAEDIASDELDIDYIEENGFWTIEQYKEEDKNKEDVEQQ